MKRENKSVHLAIKFPPRLGRMFAYIYVYLTIARYLVIYEEPTELIAPLLQIRSRRFRCVIAKPGSWLATLKVAVSTLVFSQVRFKAECIANSTKSNNFL